jgi:hypothetical protein
MNRQALARLQTLFTQKGEITLREAIDSLKQDAKQRVVKELVLREQAQVL